MKTDNLHFPSFGKKAVEFLISKRKIKAIGIDTASTDYGPSEMFQVHRVSAKANVIGLEKFKKSEKTSSKRIDYYCTSY